MARTTVKTYQSTKVPNDPNRTLAKLKALSEQIEFLATKQKADSDVSSWITEVKLVLEDAYGRDSLLFDEFGKIRFFSIIFDQNQPQSESAIALKNGLSQARYFLNARIVDLEEGLNDPIPETQFVGKQPPSKAVGAKIFLIHGQNNELKQEIARFLEKLGLEPVILHEQPDMGKTIIEKFHAHANVSFAIALLTGDDEGGPNGSPEKKLRARQNVVFELGFFIGSLGRDRVCALYEPSVELPSDINGVLYISIADSGLKIKLVRELEAAGFEIDANKLL